jgi:hypothetical protein
VYIWGERKTTYYVSENLWDASDYRLVAQNTKWFRTHKGVLLPMRQPSLYMGQRKATPQQVTSYRRVVQRARNASAIARRSLDRAIREQRQVARDTNRPELAAAPSPAREALQDVLGRFASAVTRVVDIQPAAPAAPAPAWTENLPGIHTRAAPCAPSDMSELNCAICLGDDHASRRTVICLPCAHLCACAECAKKLGNSPCPICKEPVAKLSFVYT